MLGHKPKLNKFLKTEIMSYIFSSHKGIKQQKQDKEWKVHKHIEIEQHIPK
jgi:hypothetical protein